MSLGITLLCKLGLTEEEAVHIKDRQNTNYVFARDQGGIGYTTPKLSLLPDLDSTYSRLAAMSSFSINEAPKIEIKPVQNRIFIPKRLQKKDVNSFSNEDLSSIFIQSNSMTEQLDKISQNLESPKKKRHHRHHHQKEDEQDSPCNDQIESPVADNIPNSTNTNQTITESTCTTKNDTSIDESRADTSENNEQKKHRKRRHRNKSNDQVIAENS